MRYSIHALLALTFVVALTCGVTIAGEGYPAYVLLGIISLMMSASLALPFVCKKSNRPFWAAYGTTTAYAMIVRGRDVDPFVNLIMIPVLWLLGDLSTLDGRPVAQWILGGVQIWTPALMGVIAGTCFAVACRFAAEAPVAD